MGERAPVDVAMQGIVADVIERDVALLWSDLHGSEAAKER